MEYWKLPERISRPELLARVLDKQGLVCLLTERVDDELLNAAPHLRIAANVAVGFDNIDLPACTQHKVAATNTPGVLDETTADFAWTLMMAVARRLGEGEALTRSGNWKGWDLDQLTGTDVWGKTLGLVGFGRIGTGAVETSSTHSVAGGTAGGRDSGAGTAGSSTGSGTRTASTDWDGDLNCSTGESGSADGAIEPPAFTDDSSALSRPRN